MNLGYALVLAAFCSTGFVLGVLIYYAVKIRGKCLENSTLFVCMKCGYKERRRKLPEGIFSIFCKKCHYPMMAR